MAIPLFGFTPQQTRITIPQQQPDSGGIFGNLFERAFLDSMGQESARRLQKKKQEHEVRRDLRTIQAQRMRDTRLQGFEEENIELQDELQTDRDVRTGLSVPYSPEAVQQLTSQVPGLSASEVEAARVGDERQYINRSAYDNWMRSAEQHRVEGIEGTPYTEGYLDVLEGAVRGSDFSAYRDDDITRLERVQFDNEIDDILRAAGIKAQYASIAARNDDEENLYAQAYLAGAAGELFRRNPTTNAHEVLSVEERERYLDIFAKSASGRGDEVSEADLKWAKDIGSQQYIRAGDYGTELLKQVQQRADAFGGVFPASYSVDETLRNNSQMFTLFADQDVRNNEQVTSSMIAAKLAGDPTFAVAYGWWSQYRHNPDGLEVLINKMGGIGRLPEGGIGPYALQVLNQIDGRFAPVSNRLLNAEVSAGTGEGSTTSSQGLPMPTVAMGDGSGGMPTIINFKPRGSAADITYNPGELQSHITGTWTNLIGAGVPQNEIVDFITLVTNDDDGVSISALESEANDIINAAMQHPTWNSAPVQEGIRRLQVMVEAAKTNPSALSEVRNILSTSYAAALANGTLDLTQIQ